MDNQSTLKLSRRIALTSLGAGIAAAVAPRVSSAQVAPLPLTTAATEGPYYLDPKKERSDITEGLPGVPLEVQFTVTDVHGQALKGLRVDLWHCDAQGRYSGFAGAQGQTSLEDKTFLRGHQVTAADGLVRFRSIYPGWYEGRTTHLHFKVINGSRTVLTSQFFLPDALNEFLYTNLPQYKRASLRDTLNSTDGIALHAGETVIGSVREQGDRYVASLALVVDPRAKAQVDRSPQGRMPPPAGRPDRPGARGPQTPSGDARVSALVPGDRKR